MKSPAYFLITALMLLDIPFAAAFCYVPQPRRTCAEYFASQLVVEATLEQARAIRDKNDPSYIEAHIYTLAVSKVMRGDNVGFVHVYDGNDSGRVTFDWKHGRKYLLFLTYVSSENSWALDSCGNSGPLDEAKSAVSEIEAIRTVRDVGIIYGIVSHQALSFPISGQQVEVRGTGGTFSAISNEKGEFEIHVPIGEYSVRTVNSTASFQKADISYEDPQAIQVQPGGCAQVQLAEIE